MSAFMLRSWCALWCGSWMYWRASDTDISFSLPVAPEESSPLESELVRWQVSNWELPWREYDSQMAIVEKAIEERKNPDLANETARTGLEARRTTSEDQLRGMKREEEHSQAYKKEHRGDVTVDPSVRQPSDVDGRVSQERQHQLREFAAHPVPSSEVEERLVCISLVLERAAAGALETAENTLRNCTHRGTSGHAETDAVTDSLRKLVFVEHALGKVRKAKEGLQVRKGEEILVCLSAALEYTAEGALEKAESILRNCTQRGPSGHVAADAVTEHLRKLVQQLKTKDSQFSIWSILAFIAQIVATMFCVIPRGALREKLAGLYPVKDLETAHNTGDQIEQSTHEQTHANGSKSSDAAQVSHGSNTRAGLIDAEDKLPSSSAPSTDRESSLLASIAKLEADLVEMEKRAQRAESRVEGMASDADTSSGGVAEPRNGTKLRQVQVPPLRLPALPLVQQHPEVSSMADQDSPPGSNRSLNAMFAFQTATSSGNVSSASKPSVLVDREAKAVAFDENAVVLKTLRDEIEGLQQRVTAASDEREVLRSELHVATRQLTESRAENEMLSAEVSSLRSRYADLAKDAQKKLVDAAAREKAMRAKSKGWLQF